jgi:hypothetical protein
MYRFVSGNPAGKNFGYSSSNHITAFSSLARFPEKESK